MSDVSYDMRSAGLMVTALKLFFGC